MYTSLMVRRAATVSKDEAQRRLAEKYPGYTVTSFTVEVDDDNNKFYVARLVQSDHPEVGIEPPIDDAPPSEEDAPAEDAPPEEDEGDDELKKLEHKIDQLAKMVHKLVGGDVDESGEPETAGKPTKLDNLPPPVPDPGGGLGGGMRNPLMAKRLAGRLNLTTVRDNSADVKLADAKAELETEFGPYGFKVKKMVRRDDKIVAGLVREAVLKDELIPDEENIDPVSGQRLYENQRSQRPWQGNDAPRVQSPGEFYPQDQTPPDGLTPDTFMTPEELEELRKNQKFVG